MGLLWLIGSPARAQSSVSKKYEKTVKKADRLYEFFSYTTAAERYEQALEEAPDNVELIRQLARCYHRLNDPAQTTYWYTQLADSLAMFTPEDKLHYAQALASNKNYDEAQRWYAAYGAASSDQQLARSKQAALDQLSTFFQDSAFYSVTPTEVNTEYADFGPAYLGKGIVYASAREGGSSGKRYGWYNQVFLDLYYAPLNEHGQPGTPQRLTSQVNTRFHEGPATFYADGQRVIFTRNNYYGHKKGKSSENEMKLKLFTAVRPDTVLTDWTDIKPFPHNSEEYSTGHPTVSADGSRLYFVSDKPGGQGGTDLYVCQWQRNTWSRPVNLGDHINTSGDEMFPFIHPSGVLYFASNGHGGLGGLDIYRVDLKKGNDAKIYNLGYPINSSQDDFGLIADETENTGFFSTNRNAGVGDDNIYHFRYHPTKTVEVHATVLSAQDSTPLASSLIMLQYPQGDTLTEVRTDANGMVTLPLTWERDYRVAASQEGYLEDEAFLSTRRGEPRTDSVTLYLARPLVADNTIGSHETERLTDGSPSVMVQGVITNRETKQLLPGTTVTIENIETQEKSQCVADSAARYRFAIRSNQQYRVRAEREKYISASLSFDTEGRTGLLTYDIAMDSIEVGKVVRLDRIFYDFDKWDIRSDAIPQLDHLLEALRENPTMSIELSSHTDVRGSDGYNQYLSSQRAQVVVSYLIAQGIRPDRMVAKGYGETKLMNECENDVPCSEEKHQENRRTEFMITEY